MRVEKNPNIFFCSENILNIDNVQNISIEKISHEFLNVIKKIDYFKNDKNKLWEKSFLRIFYIYIVAKNLKINEFVHFDSDVVLYKPFEELESLFVSNKLNITPVNELFLNFSYSYINNLDVLEEICTDLIEIINNSKKYEEKYYKNKRLNEMIMLNIANINKPQNFNLLDTVPEKNKKILFDPAGYGQYLGGLDKKILSKRSIDPDHYLGRELLKKGFEIKFKQGRPIVIDEKITFEIANLHVHKKNLKKFMPR
tara:strand:+ start:908 stop:1672 length:765 start_codon:yes stop_codon:yes gene_type:complete